MFEYISSLLNQGLGIIVPMVILLGLLIFVHELGHFLAAKFYRVRVETFSLGFGPKLFKFIKGDTTYCLSALPLGGYVKMYGDEPGKDIPEHLQSVSFYHKPVGQRFVIALAGPVMNLFFAVVLFYFVALVGDKTLAPTIGELAPNSKAFTEGFRQGDQILSVNGAEVSSWDGFLQVVNASADRQLIVTLQRGSEVVTLRPIPEEVVNKDVLSVDKKIGQIKGLSNELHLPFIGLSPRSPLVTYGLSSGDHITHINGIEVKYYKDIQPLISQEWQRGEKHIGMQLKRYEQFTGKDPKYEELKVNIDSQRVDPSHLGIFIPQTVVAEVKDGSPAAVAGVKKFDRLAKINGIEMLSFSDIVDAVSSYRRGDKPLTIDIERGPESLSLTITPEPTDLEGMYGITENRYTIGIVPLKNAVGQTFLWKARDITQSLNHAIGETYRWTKITCLSFIRMIQGSVPAKNIGGFISIGQVAHSSWNIGIGAFLKIMAIISINLFILNLLPIPILDGGHLMLFSLEAIKGSPLSLKKIEVAQQVGFLFILFLMAFALFNDFSRLFGS